MDQLLVFNSECFQLLSTAHSPVTVWGQNCWCSSYFHFYFWSSTVLPFHTALQADQEWVKDCECLLDGTVKHFKDSEGISQPILFKAKINSKTFLHTCFAAPAAMLALSIPWFLPVQISPLFVMSRLRRLNCRFPQVILQKMHMLGAAGPQLGGVLSSNDTQVTGKWTFATPYSGVCCCFLLVLFHIPFNLFQCPLCSFIFPQILFFHWFSFIFSQISCFLHCFSFMFHCCPSVSPSFWLGSVP